LIEDLADRLFVENIVKKMATGAYVPKDDASRFAKLVDPAISTIFAKAQKPGTALVSTEQHDSKSVVEILTAVLSGNVPGDEPPETYPEVDLSMRAITKIAESCPREILDECRDGFVSLFALKNPSPADELGMALGILSMTASKVVFTSLLTVMTPSGIGQQRKRNISGGAQTAS